MLVVVLVVRPQVNRQELLEVTAAVRQVQVILQILLQLELLTLAAVEAAAVEVLQLLVLPEVLELF
jgi:hypothetical protein